MGNRLSKIITASGDQGMTRLADGSERAKNDVRVQCLGEVDELNAWIGLCSSLIAELDKADLLRQVQHDLFDLGAELSLPGQILLTQQHVSFLEDSAQQMNEQLPPLREFILPGGSALLGYLHLARTVSRRVERSCVALNQQENLNPLSLIYLNRLSDWLFILTRFMAKQTATEEIFWHSSYSRKNPS